MFNPLMVQAANKSRFPLCLYSATSTNFTEARYSFLPDNPELVLYQDGQGQCWHNGQPQPSFDDCLDRLIAERAHNRKDDNSPFTGGWVVYYGFESYLNWRDLSTSGSADASADLPAACLWRIDRVLVHDRDLDRLRYYCDGREQDELPVDIVEALATPVPEDSQPAKLVSYQEENENIFLDACIRTVEAITRGDVIQVNLSRPWTLEFDRALNADALAVALARLNPSPFFCQFPLGEQTIISASPERLFRIQDGKIQTQPLGGTIKRDLDDMTLDASHQQQLLNDGKLKSEHIMLVDLERNDISRVCQPDSVHVRSLMQVETHPFLHHLVSVIEGRLRKMARLSEVFRAMCPGGSISGCPKKMCLQIIKALEQEQRHWFTGAFGYVDDNGSADVNLLIRSMAVCGNTIRFRMGAGIVADSVASQELAETRLKAHGLLRAIAAVTDPGAQAGLSSFV